MPRLLANALRDAAREIRRDVKHGARWADSHVEGTDTAEGTAYVTVDSSIGWDESRHPERGKSPLPPTKIVVVAGRVRRSAA